MWTNLDLSGAAKVRLVWHETLNRTEANGPIYKAEVVVVKIDLKQASRGFFVICPSFMSDLAWVEDYVLKTLARRGLLEPMVKSPEGNEASQTRWFAAWCDDWFNTVSQLAYGAGGPPK